MVEVANYIWEEEARIDEEVAKENGLSVNVKSGKYHF
jgi:hypothetical protein